MKFYHFTSLKKNQIIPNESYETNWVESNYWLHKQRNRQENNEMNSALEGIGTILKAFGKDFDLSSISKEMQSSKYYSELLKEYIFEEVRQKEFPEKPSRKNCMFLVPIEVNLNNYCKNMGFNTNQLTMLEVDIENDSKYHFADFTLLNCNNLIHDEKVEKAKEYWNGTDRRDMNTEILFRGKFKIEVRE